MLLEEDSGNQIWTTYVRALNLGPQIMTLRAPITPDVLTVPRKDSSSNGRINLLGLTWDKLFKTLVQAGTPERQARMRSRQVWQWMYHWGVRDFAAMTNLSKAYRAMLDERFVISLPEVVRRQVSADGTRKLLVRIAGGHEVETVYIPEEDRGTLCVSSQVGCTLTCSFCHTGTQKLVRNLAPDEIVGQVMLARDDLGEWPEPGIGSGETGPRLLSNVVLMGMGEPLYNFDAVRDAMKIVMDGEGIALSRRRITLSTSGVVPEIARTAKEIGCMLAVSFHATTDEVRNQLVPINRRWNIAELLDALRAYPKLSNSERITFEYVMLKGVNGQRRGRPAARQADPGHSREGQPDPVQRVAGRAVRTVRPIPDQGLCRHRAQGRLRLAGAHSARRGHHGGLRPAQVGYRTGPEEPGRSPRRGRTGIGCGAFMLHSADARDIRDWHCGPAVTQANPALEGKARHGVRSAIAVPCTSTPRNSRQGTAMPPDVLATCGATFSAASHP